MSETTTSRSRPGLLALLSSVLPGLGHLLAGRGRIGITLLLVDFVLLGVVLAGVLLAPTELAKLWVTPSALLVLLAINVLIFAFRGAATANSFGGVRRRLDWLLAAVAALVLIVPHVVIGTLAYTQYDLITSVFAPTPAAVATGHTTTTLAEQPREVRFDGSTTTTSHPATTTTTQPPRIWDRHGRLNILLLGSDAGVGRIGTRTDTIILVSIEPESGDVAMFSVPRNLTEAPLPEGMGRWSCNCFPDIITHLWANGEWYPDDFPGPQSPSVNALKAAVGLTFGVEVHYYAKVDLAGFVEVFDALGGVTVDVPKRLVDPIYPHEDGGTERIVIEEGVQHLDGHLALAYSRIRRNSGDFARMHRQRCVLGALVTQTGFLDLITGYGALATAVKDHVETDIPIDALGDFVELIPKIETDRIASLRITRYNYGVSGHAGYQIYDLERLRLDALSLMSDPTQALDTQDGVGLEDTCDESFD